MIDGLPKMIAGLMTQSGIALLTGHGVLVDNHTIEINGKQRVTGEKNRACHGAASKPY